MKTDPPQMMLPESVPEHGNALFEPLKGVPHDLRVEGAPEGSQDRLHGNVCILVPPQQEFSLDELGNQSPDLCHGVYAVGGFV